MHKTPEIAALVNKSAYTSIFDLKQSHEAALIFFQLLKQDKL